MRITEDGGVVMIAGKPSLTQVAAEYLAGLRREHEEWLEEMWEMIRSVKLPPEMVPPE